MIPPVLFFLKTSLVIGRSSVVQSSLMDSVAEGEGGKIWENGIETRIISCMKRVASPGSILDAWG